MRSKSDEWMERMYQRKGYMGKGIVWAVIMLGAAMALALFVIAYTLAWAVFG